MDFIDWKNFGIMSTVNNVFPKCNVMVLQTRMDFIYSLWKAASPSESEKGRPLLHFTSGWNCISSTGVITLSNSFILVKGGARWNT